MMISNLNKQTKYINVNQTEKFKIKILKIYFN